MDKCCDNCKSFKCSHDKGYACSELMNTLDWDTSKDICSKFEKKTETPYVYISKNRGCIGGTENVLNYFRKRIEESLDSVKDWGIRPKEYNDKYRKAFSWILEDEVRV